MPRSGVPRIRNQEETFFMSVIFLIILGYILYLILRPMWKVWSISRRFRKGDYTVFSDLFGQPGAQPRGTAGSSTHRKAGWDAPGARRKKIGKDVGEYVRFQEVEVDPGDAARASSRSESASAADFVREEQITDVEWEEIR